MLIDVCMAYEGQPRSQTHPFVFFHPVIKRIKKRQNTLGIKLKLSSYVFSNDWIKILNISGMWFIF